MRIVKLPQKTIFFLFLLYAFIIPIISVILKDYTGAIARYSLVIYLFPIGFFLLETIIKNFQMKKIYMPQALGLFFILLVFGSIIREPSIRESLNILSYIVPYLGIMVILRFIKSEYDLKRMIDIIINCFFAIFITMIIYTIIITYFGMSNLHAPQYQLWQANGFTKPLRLMSYTGHHVTNFMAGFTSIFLIYRIHCYRKTKNRKVIYSYSILLVLSCIMLVWSSSRVALLLIGILIPMALLYVSFRIVSPILITIITTLFVVLLYLAVTNSDIMLLILNAANTVQGMIDVRITNLGYIPLFSGRENLWGTLLHMISDNPLVGHGHPLPFHSYGITSIRHYSDPRVGGSMFQAISESGLLLAAKYGLPAFIAFIIFFIKPTFYLRDRSITLLINMVVSYAILLFMVNGTFIISFDFSIMIIFLLFVFNKYSWISRIENKTV